MSNIRSLVLFGVSGSGKSTVGRQLSQTLGYPFLEGDDFHPPQNVAKMRAGLALDDADRLPWLDRIGAAIAGSETSVVTACSALKRIYRRRLAAATERPLTFVHLRIDPIALRERLDGRHGHFMPASLLASQLATFEPLDPDEQGFAVMTGNGVDDSIDAILRHLEHRPV